MEEEFNILMESIIQNYKNHFNIQRDMDMIEMLDHAKSIGNELTEEDNDFLDSQADRLEEFYKKHGMM